MKVMFVEEGHSYSSVPVRSWTSVTKVVDRFCPEFDEQEQAKKASSNERSKWYGIHPTEILDIWAAERDRSTEAGSWYHAKMEKKLVNMLVKDHRGRFLSIYETPFIDAIKIAKDQVLDEGIYPEHIIYNEKIGVVGQSDVVCVYDDFVDILDYKTNKEMKLNSFVNYQGESSMMLSPVHNIEDCNYWHYALQLSLYMYLILLKNPNLKPGTMHLIHVTFQVENYNQYGFPILATNENGYIVKETTKYEVPYLKNEVIAMLKSIYKAQ